MTKPQPSIPDIYRDFLIFPFRLYFILACLSLFIFAPLWSYVGLTIYPFAVSPIYLHAYGFLNGVGGAAFIGFILTAVPEWTHDTRPLSRHSLYLLFLWLAGCGTILFSISSLAFTLMWAYLAFLVAHMSWKARDDRQLSIIILLSSITLLNSLFFVDANLVVLKTMAHVFLAGVSLITFRIGRAIGQKALENTHLKDCQFVPNPFYRNLSVWFIYLYALSLLFVDHPYVQAWLAVAAGLALLGRLRDWHYPILLKKYYIRWYYLTLFATGSAYIWLGISTLLSLNTITAAFHLLMFMGFLLMIMQVFSIAGAVHSSLNLGYPASSRVAMGLIVLGGLSRAFGGFFPSLYTELIFYAPAICLCLAFALYMKTYIKIFLTYPGVEVSPRVK